MNDMTDAELVRKLERGEIELQYDDSHNDRLKSIATKMERYPDLARAVLEAYDRWKFVRFHVSKDHPTYVSRLEENGGMIFTATGKHPSDWTREGLMEYLGVSDND